MHFRDDLMMSSCLAHPFNSRWLVYASRSSCIVLYLSLQDRYPSRNLFYHVPWSGLFRHKCGCRSSRSRCSRRLRYISIEDRQYRYYSMGINQKKRGSHWAGKLFVFQRFFQIHPFGGRAWKWLPSRSFISSRYTRYLATKITMWGILCSGSLSTFFLFPNLFWGRIRSYAKW